MLAQACGGAIPLWYKNLIDNDSHLQRGVVVAIMRRLLTTGLFEMNHKVKPGQHYRVRCYAVGMDKSYRHKLMAMGVIPGAEFEVLRVAPLGDPIQLSLHGYSLCLRSRDLGLLQLDEVALA